MITQAEMDAQDEAYEQLLKDEQSGKVPFVGFDAPPLPPLPTEEGDVVAMFVPKKPSE